MMSGLSARSAEPIVPKFVPGLEVPEYPSWPGNTESEPLPGPVMVDPGTGIEPGSPTGSPPC